MPKPKFEKEKFCKRCETPFDSSWSANPSKEEFCSDYCKQVYKRGR